MCGFLCVCIWHGFWLCVAWKKKNSLHVRRGFTDTKTENRLQTFIGGNSDALYCPLVARNACSGSSLMSPGQFLFSATIVAFWCGSWESLQWCHWCHRIPVSGSGRVLFPSFVTFMLAGVTRRNPMLPNAKWRCMAWWHLHGSQVSDGKRVSPFKNPQVTPFFSPSI